MTGPETETQGASDEKLSSPDERLERRRKKAVAVGFFLFVILLWLAIHFLNKALTFKNTAAGGRNQLKVVEIAPGSSLSDIARELGAKQVITLSRLEQGHVMLHEFTIPEGFTVKQIAERLEKSDLSDAEEFMRLTEDSEFCAELGVEGSTLEGFLFPDTYKIARGLSTYKIARGLSTRDVIQVMIDRFWSVWAREAGKKGPIKGHSLREIVTIASIIEKEALFDSEKPLVASVIYNRLDSNIPLQCRPENGFALQFLPLHGNPADPDMQSRPFGDPGVARTRRDQLPVLRLDEQRPPQVLKNAQRAQQGRAQIPDPQRTWLAKWIRRWNWLPPLEISRS